MSVDKKIGIAIVGSGPITSIAAKLIMAQTDNKAVIIVNDQPPIPKIKPLIPLLMPQEPTNRRARRKKLRAKHKRR